jgi:ABC-type multidrug transport system ATPase subunit
MNAATLETVSKSYGSVRALREVSLCAPAGMIYGLIGADGAGKSTLMHIWSTLQTPDAGRATVLGRAIDANRGALRQMIGYMPQRFSLYQDLSVLENIHFFADIFGVRGSERRSRIRDLLAFARLEPFAHRRAGKLSGGMKQKLALCCALVHQPAVVFLDEPTVGVDPVSRREFWTILHALRADGVTIVLATPYMDEAAQCDRLALLHRGSRIEEGTPEELTQRYPLALYRISDFDQQKQYPRAEALGDDIVLSYPAAGNLHIAALAAATPREVSERIRQSTARLPERVAPTVEDVFIAKLAGVA